MPPSIPKVKSEAAALVIIPLVNDDYAYTLHSGVILPHCYMWVHGYLCVSVRAYTYTHTCMESSLLFGHTHTHTQVVL